MDAAALAAVVDFPSLAQSRGRVIALAESSNGSCAALTAALESDLALVLAVVREACAADASRQVTSVADAIEVLPAKTIASIARRLQPYDPFSSRSSGALAPDTFLLHSRGVQRLADALARRTGYRRRDELLTAAVLHDVGKLVLAHLHPGYATGMQAGDVTPEQRANTEQRQFGESHAAVGARVVEALGLPASLAKEIEAHHSRGASGGAALIRLADMLVHYRGGRRIDFHDVTAAATAVGLGREDLGALIYELTEPIKAPPPAACPLSGRELEVLRELASGKVYKEIASELGLSPNTVRNHMHHMYQKLGSSDRAQAVLLASEHGWL